MTNRLHALGIAHVVVGQAPDVRIEVDPDRVLQALSNLVLNAVVHTHEGTRVAVDAAIEGRHVVLTVCDDGPGLPPDVMERFGETFVRGSVDGTGLGLAVSRAVARAHGGTLEAITGDSGTTIRLRLPIDAENPRDLHFDPEGE